MSEQVNHPSHYNIAGKRECIVAMQEDYGDYITITFCLTNAYKYLYRAGMKEGNSQEQDIAKAKWYYDYAQGLIANQVDFVDGTYIMDLDEYVEEELKRYGF